MNLKFVTNDYVIIWNLLFQASISEYIHKLKQKIWKNYKNEYNETYNDKIKILKDYKNFIPDDDTIYNIVLEDKEYESIKKDVDKQRIKLLEVWDENKKKAIKELKEILRFDIKIYHVLVVPEKINVIYSEDIKSSRVNTIVWGKKIKQNSIVSIIELVHNIVKKELKNYKESYKDIVEAILELAIINEFATRMIGVSYYSVGDKSLSYLKRQIYPYWLMYLGVEKNEMREYMNRDKIFFDESRYTNEVQLKKIDLYEFIDFCIRNQKHIVKIDELEIL